MGSSHVKVRKKREDKAERSKIDRDIEHTLEIRLDNARIEYLSAEREYKRVRTAVRALEAKPLCFFEGFER
jgi:hypothetical protein